MNTSNLNYVQAEAAMNNGQFVALASPEWGGFWFKMPDGVKALTLPSKLVKAQATENVYQGNWQIVDGKLSIGEALVVLKAGLAIRRIGWNSEEYVFIRPADTLDRSIVGVVKSLPTLIKALLYREYKSVSFSEYLCKAVGSEITNGWLPTTEELLAEDWVIATDVR